MFSFPWSVTALAVNHEKGLKGAETHRWTPWDGTAFRGEEVRENVSRVERGRVRKKQ